MTDGTSHVAPGEIIDRAWREKRWPTSLLERARALPIPDTQIERLLSWNVPLERFELEVAWAEKLVNGDMQFRQVTFADADAFRELWANAPEEIGDWDVTAERGANAFAQFELQERPVLNALFDKTAMVACVSFSLRNAIVAGRRLSVRFGQAMRVHKDHRRHGYGNWVRSLPWAIGLNMATEVQYDYIRSRNMLMERWNSTHMPNVDSVPKREDDVPGIPVSVLQYGARATTPHQDIRSARAEDLRACVSLINRTHRGRDLFRPYTPEFLEDCLDPGFQPSGPQAPTPVYSFDDYYVVERSGRIVACAGAWDRGRDIREYWRNRGTNEERAIAVMSMLDVGYDEGESRALASLVEHFISLAHHRGRDYLVAPLERFPDVASLLVGYEPIVDTRYMQWRADDPAITSPIHLDLRYW